jgi:flagellar basal body rod protein FlgC
MAKGQRRESVTPLILMIFGSVLILGVVIWRTIQVLPSVPAQQPTATASGFLPYPNVNRISLADAKAAYDSASAVFIDVRGDPSYSTSHIKGALDIAYADIVSGMADLDKSKHYILYCT